LKSHKENGMLSIAISQSPFISLPQLDWGKIWRWLKVNNPVRPEENKAKIVCAIMDEGDRVPASYVFSVPNDNQLFYVHVKEMSGELETTEDGQKIAAYKILNPHPNLIKAKNGGARDTQPRNIMQGWKAGAIAKPAAQKLIAESYYGKEKAPSFLAKLSFA